MGNIAKSKKVAEKQKECQKSRVLTNMQPACFCYSALAINTLEEIHFHAQPTSSCFMYLSPASNFTPKMASLRCLLIIFATFLSLQTFVYSSMCPDCFIPSRATNYPNSTEQGTEGKTLILYIYM